MSNPYFRAQHGNVNEGNLYESLIIENIEISGNDCYYIPRTLSTRLDNIFGEDVLSSFNSYAEICCYVSDITDWGGEQAMLAKFGMEQRNTATFILARKKYTELVVPIVPEDRSEALKWRPNEGDLIYTPFSKSLFEIKYVEDEEPSFYQLNRKFVWTIRCELIQLNNETFKTGVDEIDDKFNNGVDRLSYNFLLEDGNSLLTELGGCLLQEEYTVGEPFEELASYGDNNSIKKEFMDIMNFNSDNPFNERF